MPNRMLRDWTDSDKFDGLSAESERLFSRLIMKADDYGRFHAEARRVKAACFPLIEELPLEKISQWLGELESRRLIIRYSVEGMGFLSIPQFRQRLKRSVPKFPQLPGTSREWLPDSDHFRELPGTSGNFPLEVEGEANAEVEGEGEGDFSPHPDFTPEPLEISSLPKSTPTDVSRILAGYPLKQGLHGATYAVEQAVTRLRQSGESNPVQKIIDAVAVYSASDVVKRGKILAAKRFFDEGHYDNDPTSWEDKKPPPEPSPEELCPPTPPGFYEELAAERARREESTNPGEIINQQIMKRERARLKENAERSTGKSKGEPVGPATGT